MSDTKTMFGDGWASLELDEELYPREAIQGAAYVLLERSYIFLERAGDKGDKRVRVRLRAKSGPGDTKAVAGEFENEALAQAYRRRLATENRAYIEMIAGRALAGAAGPPGLDDLLAMDIGAETAFEDPLGIAMSWEEKYAKKKAAKGEGPSEGPTEAGTPDQGAPRQDDPGSEKP